MVKYIDTDKLIANLERQNVDKKIIQPLIHIIESLQQEQPEVDLEKEIVRYTKKSLLLPITNSITPMDIMESDWIKCARHFAEWGAAHLNARKEESK